MIRLYSLIFGNNLICNAFAILSYGGNSTKFVITPSQYEKIVIYV
jgi:hypothetical protein